MEKDNYRCLTTPPAMNTKLYLSDPSKSNLYRIINWQGTRIHRYYLKEKRLYDNMAGALKKSQQLLTLLSAMKFAPELNTVVYIINFDTVGNVVSSKWTGSLLQMKMLSDGRVFASKAVARLASKAAINTLKEFRAKLKDEVD